MVFYCEYCIALCRFSRKISMKLAKSYSKLRSFLAGLVAVSMAITLSVSCREGSGSEELAIKDDPVGTYRKFLTEIRGLENLSVEELAVQMKRWQARWDSVFTYTIQDTTQIPLSDLYGKCGLLHDSLRTEFSRLALSQKRSYQDVFVIKELTSPYHGDKELTDAAANARAFFRSHVSLPPLAADKDNILPKYRHLLAGTEHDGIHDLTDLKSFIANEDAVFRTFLSHLNSFGGENLSDITQGTERCCSQVFLAAERQDISYRDAMVYMAMRTNRRLIQNVTVCINDIREIKVKTRLQAWGYACMMLQPYISIDGICAVLLSAQEKEELGKIAEQTPAALARLGEVLQSDKDRLEEFPGTLMGLYIQTL